MKLIQGGKKEGGAHQNPPFIEASEDTLTFVLMTLGDETFAVLVDKVKEIVRVPNITWVPGTTKPVLGVMNLRGAAVPVVDLGNVLSMKATEENDDSRIVVMEGNEGLVGMMVSGVTEVVDICITDLQPTMQTLDERQQLLVEAQFNCGDNLVGVLDIDRVIYITCMS